MPPLAHVKNGFSNSEWKCVLFQFSSTLTGGRTLTRTGILVDWSFEALFLEDLKLAESFVEVRVGDGFQQPSFNCIVHRRLDR